MTPTISCVIPVRDSEAFIAQAVDNALGQRYLSDRVEVVVVDDGSVDSTPEILDAYGDRIRRIRPESSVGVPAGVGAGLVACTGAFVRRLDAHDVYPPDRFGTMAKVLAREPQAGL